MHVSKKVKILLISLGILINLFALKYAFSNSKDVSIGFVVSERCKEQVHNYLSKWEGQGIDISYLPVNNNEGGFYTFAKEYVALTTTKFDQKFLIGVMNGSLVKCGRDGIIESQIDNENLIPNLKNYVKVLKQNGIKGSLIVEIKGNDVLIHENSILISK